MRRGTVSTDAELDQVIDEIEGFFDATPVPGSEDIHHEKKEIRYCQRQMIES